MKVKFVSTATNSVILLDPDEFPVIVPGLHPESKKPILKFYQDVESDSYWEVYGTQQDLEPPPETLESKYYQENKQKVKLKVLPAPEPDEDDDEEEEEEEEEDDE